MHTHDLLAGRGDMLQANAVDREKRQKCDDQILKFCLGLGVRGKPYLSGHVGVLLVLVCLDRFSVAALGDVAGCIFIL